MQVGALLAGRFELRELAASGGMGEVYRAHDRETGEPVAVKRMIAGVDDVARFVRESELLAMLRHPGIVRYVAHGASRAGCYLAMQWLEGEDLRKRLRRSGRLDVAETLALARAAAAALGEAHRHGVVHRDVKPSNLFLVGGDPARACLVDFGVARLDAAPALTAPGLTVGTPGYMAPEQARGEAADARADVFSLGCVLHACLAGRPPFAGRGVAVLAKIVFEEAPLLREIRADVPPALDALVARMMAKHRDERPRDGAEVAAALADLEAAETTAPPAAPVLTAGESRLVGVVLVAGRDPGDEQTVLAAADAQREQVLADAARRFGAGLAKLADGSAVLALFADGISEQAVRSARCALALSGISPRVALSTGRALLRDRLPVGEVVDRAEALLALPPPAAGVRVDETTAGLLPPRFEIGADAGGLLLAGERELAAPVRTLLGKATPCVGRSTELRILEAIAEGAFATPAATAALVVGPAGAGKSRLRYELVQRLGASVADLSVWIARGDPMGEGSPFALSAQMLRLLCGLRGDEPIEASRRKLRGRVARHLDPAEAPRVAAFLGEIASVPFDERDEPQLAFARRDAAVMGDQLRLAFTDLLRAECDAGPLLLVLEDLHWGDVPTMKLVVAALRALPDRPLLVLALSRPEAADKLRREWMDPAPHEVPLRRLPDAAAGELVRAVLPAIGRDAAERIVRLADGNALFLEELIRAEATPGESGRPATVVAMLQARLASLPPEARRVLRAASVFGDRFSRGGVEALAGGPIGPVLDGLVRDELVQPSPVGTFGGDEELAFRHSLVREAAYAMLTDEDRRLGHRLAGEWLEARDADPVALARHFELGAERPRAAAHYARAASDALDGNDYSGAIDRAASGIACGAAGELLGRLREVQAHAHACAGRHDEARTCARHAMRLLPAGSATWCRAAGTAAVEALVTGAADDLAGMADELETFPGRDESPAMMLRARVASALYMVGRRDEGDRLLESGAGEERLDATARAHLHAARGRRADLAGDLSTSLRERVASIEAFDEAGSVRAACAARGVLGYTKLKLGRYEEAEHELRAALAGAVRLGLHGAAASARHNLGMAVAHRGDLAEATRLEEDAVAAFAADGDRRLEGASRVYLAEILRRRGELPRAEAEAVRALDVLAGVSSYRAVARSVLARVLLAAGRVSEALVAASEAVADLEREGDLEEGEAIVRLAHVEALLAAGDREAAAAALRRARELLLQAAARIAEPSLRESFLHAVPDHARLLTLAL